MTPTPNPTAAPSPQQAVADSVLDELARQWANGTPIVLCYDGEGRPIDGWEFSMPRFRSAVRSALATLAPQAVSEPPAGVAGDEVVERAAFVAEAKRRGWTPGEFMLGTYAGWLASTLATPTHQAAEPAASDMVLVPREPTAEMASAFESQLQGAGGSYFDWADSGGIAAYRAMIAAAPWAAHEATPVPEAMELGEDTKRLDWLERESGEDIDNVEVWACWPAKHDRLRDAIDAAMLAARPPADGATKEGASHE